MVEQAATFELSEEGKIVFKEAFVQMQRGGQEKTLIQVLQLIPGVSLDQEAIGNLERTIFGSPSAMGASLYETHTPGEANKDNSWIDVICFYGGRGGKRTFAVSLSRVVDLKNLTLILEFDEDNISLQGGAIEDVEHEKYPHRNLVQRRGVIKFDPRGRIENTQGSLENFKGSIDLPGLIANLTSREGIDQPLNPKTTIAIK